MQASRMFVRVLHKHCTPNLPWNAASKLELAIGAGVNESSFLACLKKLVKFSLCSLLICWFCCTCAPDEVTANSASCIDTSRAVIACNFCTDISEFEFRLCFGFVLLLAVSFGALNLCIVLLFASSLLRCLLAVCEFAWLVVSSVQRKTGRRCILTIIG